MANIQNYLNQIKTAVFGKDVRESIHDAIKQCYDDATVNHDNANMEVKLARGSHNTLNDRLDENEKNQENLSSQLDTKANKPLKNIPMSIYKMQNNLPCYGVAIGDSITFGAKNNPDTTQNENHYPSILQQNLRTLYENDNIVIENQGVSGSGTSFWVNNNANEYLTRAINKSPDFVIIMLGINDAQGGLEAPNYINNIEKLVDIAIKNNIEVILMSSTPTLAKSDWGVQKDSNAVIGSYASLLKTLSENKGISFVDIQNKILKKCYMEQLYNLPNLLHKDLVHLTDYSIIANCIIEDIFDKCLVVTDNIVLPIAGSKYVNTNCTKENIVDSQAGATYSNLYNFEKSSDKYIKLNFICNKNGLSLKAVYARLKAYGIMNVYLNGVSIAINEGYTTNDKTTLYGNIITISEHIPLGFNTLEFNTDNLNSGYFNLEALIFEVNECLQVSNVATKVIKGNIGIKEIGFMESKNNLNTVIEMKGLFENKIGVSLFTTKKNEGYQYSEMVYFWDGKISIVEYNFENTDTAFIIKGENIYDLSKKHEVRIDICFPSIKVYVDDVLEITHTVTTNLTNSGKLMIWGYDNTKDIRLALDRLNMYYI